GIIFLNDSTESLSFKAQTESGAALEILTKLSPTEIKEIIMTEDKKNLMITGLGSFPVQEKNTKKISDSLWETRIPSDFPILYLQGDGGIPIRQEFNIKGELPREKYRVSVSSNAKTKTYSQEEKLTLKIPSNFSTKPKDENSKLSIIKNQKTIWTLSNLHQKELNRRQIYIQNKEQSYLLSYDIFRGRNAELMITSKYLSSAKINLAGAELIWWLNNLYSGLKIKTYSAITKPQDITAFSITELNFLHRFSQGLNHQDSSLVVGVNYQLLKSNTLNFSLPGVSLGWERTPQSRWLKAMADWNKIYLNYYLGQKKDGLILNSVLEIEYLLQLNLINSHYLNYGFGFSKYSFDVDSDMSKNQLSATLGWAMLF
ncbi:MAG: hypothetical protein L6Q37_12355, partial [Bdellovibrionaceae bacterium]|nr:hypothetical protein [Pseudobdellovibrionaceae bacterium]